MSAYGYERSFRSGLRYMEATAVSALPSIGVRSNLKSGIVRGGRSLHTQNLFLEVNELYCDANL